MERYNWDCDLAEDLCRVYRDIERAKAATRDVCDLILTAPSETDRRREWVPASEWTKNFNSQK
jgi:hypothetical protein